MSGKLSRNKDRDWSAWGPPNEWQYVHLCLLQDIRDELKAMNAILQCKNTLRIPNYLKRIAANTAKPKKP